MYFEKRDFKGAKPPLTPGEYPIRCRITLKSDCTAHDLNHSISKLISVRRWSACLIFLRGCGIMVLFIGGGSWSHSLDGLCVLVVGFALCGLCVLVVGFARNASLSREIKSAF